VFIHDNRILSVLIARASTDRQLAALRDPAAFETAARAIPVLAAWTDRGRCRPITPVLPGGRLYNSYRGQLTDAGRVALDGLIYAGDAVCTTNPAAGRGVTTSLLQARQLIGLLEEHGRDFSSCSLAFDSWCARNIKPWFNDHVYWDTDLIRRWSGQDVDLTRPLPPDLVIAAAQADPGLIKVIGPYQAMLAPPASLDAVQARARAIYASGWRPPIPPGPTRRELAGLVTASASSRNHPAGEAALPAAQARRRHADLGELQLASARGRLTAGRGHPARYPRRGGARRVPTIPDDIRTEEGDHGGAQTGPRLGGSVLAGGNEFSIELLHRVGSRSLGPKSDHAQLLALVRRPVRRYPPLERLGTARRRTGPAQTAHSRACLEMIG
jgi:hypothetical protein